MLHTVLLVAALICFIGAAINLKVGSVNLIGVGLALWVATLLI